jgi:hypothetical protein
MIRFLQIFSVQYVCMSLYLPLEHFICFRVITYLQHSLWQLYFHVKKMKIFPMIN